MTRLLNQLKGTLLIMRIVALLCLSLLLAGCPNLGGNNTARVTGDYAATIKKVGLLSLVDDKINVSYLTASAQESFFSRGELPGWDIDAQVAGIMMPNLKRKGFEVVPIARNEALLGLYDSDFSYAKTDRIHEQLATIAKDLGLDMVVVVARHVDTDRVTKTNQKIRGYGVQKAYGSDAFAYGSIYVEAYDTRKFFVVGKATGFQSAPLPEGLWQSSFETAKGTVTVPAEIQDALRKILQKVVGDAVAIAAQEAGV